MRRIPKLVIGWMGLAATSIAISACGADETPFEPVDELAPFVGTWDAEVFTFTSEGLPTIEADIINEAGGSFTTSIEPSGNYTSTFTCCGPTPGTSVEFGIMRVDGAFLTFTPQTGSPATSSFTFVSADYLRVEGERDFVFESGGVAEPSTMVQELRRR